MVTKEGGLIFHIVEKNFYISQIFRDPGVRDFKEPNSVFYNVGNRVGSLTLREDNKLNVFFVVSILN